MKMNKIRIFIGLLMILVLTACGSKEVKITKVPSEIYTDKDIQAAIQVIVDEFEEENRDGYTLKEISYAGDEVTLAEQKQAEFYDADEVIVLTSCFKVGFIKEDSGLEPFSTEDGWKWYLVRTKGGEWVHVDHGYA